MATGHFKDTASLINREMTSGQKRKKIISPWPLKENNSRPIMDYGYYLNESETRD